MKKLKYLVPLFLAGSTIVTWAGLDLIYRSTLDFPLYKNERYWGGSRQSELTSFLEAGRQILSAQKQLAQNTKSKKPLRVFHAKQHGCLTGKLQLFKNRPSDVDRQTFQGMFDPARKDSYDVVVRFSNGVGLIQPDRKPDVRGAAVKIFGVENQQTGKTQTVDFLMTNAPSPLGDGLLQFVSFMNSVVTHGPTLGTAIFSAENPSVAPIVFSATGLLNYKIKSLATIRYWSGHPYLLGPDMAMKFNISPSQSDNLKTKQLRKWGNDYLRTDLRTRSMKAPIKYTFNIQLEKDPKTTPIEHNLVEWKEEDSPSIPVGELVLDQQDFNKDEIEQTCENLRFTPGHYVPEHRPLSNMGRGRLFAYEASQVGRGSKDVEPDESLVKHWREINHMH